MAVTVVTKSTPVGTKIGPDTYVGGAREVLRSGKLSASEAKALEAGIAANPKLASQPDTQAQQQAQAQAQAQQQAQTLEQLKKDQSKQLTDVSAGQQVYASTMSPGMATFVATQGREGQPFFVQRGDIEYKGKTYQSFEYKGRTYEVAGQRKLSEAEVENIKRQIPGSSESYLKKLGVVDVSGGGSPFSDKSKYGTELKDTSGRGTGVYVKDVTPTSTTAQSSQPGQPKPSQPMPSGYDMSKELMKSPEELIRKPPVGTAPSSREVFVRDVYEGFRNIALGLKEGVVGTARFSFYTNPLAPVPAKMREQYIKSEQFIPDVKTTALTVGGALAFEVAPLAAALGFGGVKTYELATDTTGKSTTTKVTEALGTYALLGLGARAKEVAYDFPTKVKVISGEIPKFAPEELRSQSVIKGTIEDLPTKYGTVSDLGRVRNVKEFIGKFTPEENPFIRIVVSKAKLETPEQAAFNVRPIPLEETFIETLTGRPKIKPGSSEQPGLYAAYESIPTYLKVLKIGGREISFLPQATRPSEQFIVGANLGKFISETGKTTAASPTLRVKGFITRGAEEMRVAREQTGKSAKNEPEIIFSPGIYFKLVKTIGYEKNELTGGRIVPLKLYEVVEKLPESKQAKAELIKSTKEYLESSSKTSAPLSISEMLSPSSLTTSSAKNLIPVSLKMEEISSTPSIRVSVSFPTTKVSTTSRVSYPTIISEMSTPSRPSRPSKPSTPSTPSITSVPSLTSTPSTPSTPSRPSTPSYPKITTPPSRTPPSTPPSIQKISSEISKIGRGGQFFVVTREKGVEVKTGETGFATVREAEKFARDVVKSSISASYKIVKGDPYWLRRSSRERFASGVGVSPLEYERAKSKKLAGYVVEKSKFRLSTPGAKAGIKAGRKGF